MKGTKEQAVYLDSCAIVKRYVLEGGSEEVRETYLRAYSGDHVLVYSIWNVGEVLGALDRARRTKRLTGDDYSVTRSRFMAETRRMVKRGMASVVAIRTGVLRDAWKILEEKHVYEADALQLATARQAGAVRFLTGDAGLHKEALSIGLNSTLLGHEA